MPSASCCFLLVFCFSENPYQMKSKCSETFWQFFLEGNRSRKLRGSSRRPTGAPQATRARHPPGTPWCLVGPMWHLFAWFQRWKIIYIQKPPKVNLDEFLRRRKPLYLHDLNYSPFSAPYQRGGHHRRPSSSSRWSPWWGGSSSPSGLRVCTSSYVFYLSLSLVFLIWHDLDVSRALLI